MGKIRGLIAPVFTPFKDNGELNLGVIENYAKALFEDDNLDGILVNGTSGEGMSMTTLERKQVTETWLQAITEIPPKHRRPHVMVQVGGAPLPDVLEMAKHAEAHKADSILCLPELYINPRNVSELVAYLRLVSAAAPNTPLLYYHIPMFTNVNIHMGDFLRYIRENPGCIPTFTGIKFTSEELKEGYEALQSGYSVFLGADTLMYTASELGFDSSIATTLNFYSPNIMNKSVDNAVRQQEQEELTAQVKLITASGCGWVPTMKAAMNAISKFDLGPIRPPMKALSETQLKDLEVNLSQHGLILKRKCM